MVFSGDMLSLKTIYTSAIHNKSKFINEIYLYLAATFATFSDDKSPLIVAFSGDFFVAIKGPIQGPNISRDFSATTIISSDFGMSR